MEVDLQPVISQRCHLPWDESCAGSSDGAKVPVTITFLPENADRPPSYRLQRWHLDGETASADLSSPSRPADSSWHRLTARSPELRRSAPLCRNRDRTALFHLHLARKSEQAMNQLGRNNL
jgi:hypothetical protein